MRMQTTAGQLRTGLRLFRGIIERRCTIPVLGMVRLADGRLTGTDLDSELSVALPTIGAMDGAAAVDWYGLSMLAASVDSDETLALSDCDNSATVSFNGSEYRMASLPVGDYPDFPAVDGTRSATGNLDLVAAMRRIRMAISTEETRYYLNGVALLDGPAGPDGSPRPVLAATNGHQLAMMPLAAMPDGAAGAIIPHRVVQWLCAQPHEPEAVTFAGVQAGEDGRPRMRCDFAGMTLSAKLIDGTFPDIFRVIPRDPRPVFTLDRRATLRVLRRMRGFAGGCARHVKLTGGGETMTLSLVYGPEGRAAIERVPMGGHPPAVECGYNVDYLISILSQFTGDEVTFAADGGEIVTGTVHTPLASSPCLITSDGDPLRVVLMPVRV